MFSHTVPVHRAQIACPRKMAWQRREHSTIQNQNTRNRTSAASLGQLSSFISLGYVPQVCFTKDCQQAADLLFVVSLAVPVLILAAFLAWQLRPVPKTADSNFFEDSETGTVFEAQPGQSPERDRKGELVFKVVSYTPYPVEENVDGERIRIDVGPVGSCEPRTFVFEKLLPQPSELAVVTLERPLGLMLEEDERKKRTIVAGVAEGSRAEQRLKIAGFDRSQRANAALPGDIVRAFTCTNLVYPTRSLLFGIQPPQRHIVLFGSDGQRWEKVSKALKLGLAEDGPVSFILERRSETL